MNYKTNWYGAIGLASTIGKNSFAAGQTVSEWGRNISHRIRDWDNEVKILGYNVFENLENASQWSVEKCESAKDTFEKWEDWAEQKFIEAKKQEELNEDWRQNVNEKWSLPKPTAYRRIYNLIQEKKQKYLPQVNLETSEKATYRPNCWHYLGIC